VRRNIGARVLLTAKADFPCVRCVDVELDFVTIRVRHVHALGERPVRLIEHRDAGGVEFGLNAAELVGGVTDLERDVRETGCVRVG
jgi:hypothetical protein